MDRSLRWWLAPADDRPRQAVGSAGNGTEVCRPLLRRSGHERNLVAASQRHRYTRGRASPDRPAPERQHQPPEQFRGWPFHRLDRYRLRQPCLGRRYRPRLEATGCGACPHTRDGGSVRPASRLFRWPNRTGGRDGRWIQQPLLVERRRHAEAGDLRSSAPRWPQMDARGARRSRT